MRLERAILIVLDGCGVGAAPDAADYGDTGENTPNTLGHLAEAVGGLNLPCLQSLGLGNILPLRGVPPADAPRAHYGKVQPHSKGKDSVTGHWEMMGIHTETPFPTYPNGFPPALEALYRMCEVARELLQPPHHVQRVIARPFVGDSPDTFRRTENRRDFPLPPPENLIDALHARGIGVYGIGVVPELFVYRGFRHAERTQSNAEHYDALLRALQSDCAFIFANFEDFDMLYGHRNDPAGFARALSEFDAMLGELLTRLRPTDLLILTADHGNDPTTPSTDHSREYLPLLVYSPSNARGRDLGVRRTLADIGATVGALWGVDALNGEPIEL